MHGADSAFLAAHDLRLRRAWRRATPRPPPSGMRSGGTRTSRSSTRWSCRGSRTTTSAPPTDFALSGFYLEDETFAPDPRRCARSADAAGARTSRSSACCPDRTPLTMAGIWTSQATMASAFGDRAVPTVHLFALAPGVDSVRDREDARVGVPRERHAGRRVQEGARRRGLREPDVRPPDRGLHGPRPDRRRRRARRRQRPLGRRAPPADRRPARHRLPPAAWSQACFLLESSFIALTAIVVGTGLGLARRIQRHLGHAALSRAGRTCRSSCRGSTLAVIFAVVYGVAMLTTLRPARRASRVYPAEALRYQ